MSAPKRKREVQLNFPGLAGGTGADRAEDGPAGDKEPGSLSAQDGPGRLCGASGTAGAEGDGVSDALFQQQPEPAGPPRA